MNSLTLSEIWIYPVKSLGGIRLGTAKVCKKGLQFDRRWMLIDANGVALTQRVHPQMALFKPRIADDQMAIEYRKPGERVSTAVVRFSSDPLGPVIMARVWEDQVIVHEVDPAISEWFSNILDIRCRLVAFPEKNPRPVDARNSIADAHVSLADAYPFMVIGQKSLDDLNGRLVEPVPMNRFRPNFVFTGGNAFAEDTWKDISIGGLRFVAVKKCDRCVLTTVNQETGVKGTEPLKTLSGYRKTGNKVYFGQNMVALDEGSLSVGQRIIPA